MEGLERPMIYVINFGKPLSHPILNKLGDETEAHWVQIGVPFIYENPHAEAVRYHLNRVFGEILAYAETGIPAHNLDEEQTP